MGTILGNGNITFGNSRVQSTASGNPSYVIGGYNRNASADVWNQALTNAYVTVWLFGSYTNGASAFVGASNAGGSYTLIADVGDDNNGYTKGTFIGFPIAKNSWYYIASSATMSGSAFEDVRIYEWPIVT
jgi:hypothetical protein